MLRRSFSGVLDSGLSALATFLCGIAALRVLSETELALYSLLFTGSVLLMLIPRQTVLVPTRVQISRSPFTLFPSSRTDLRQLLPPTAVAALLVSLAGIPLFSAVPLTTYLFMSASAAMIIATSPYQEHIRASLHINGKHRSAVLTSSTAALVAVIYFAAAILSPEVVALDGAGPLLALALSNAASIALGLTFAHGLARHRKSIVMSLRNRGSILASDAVVQAAGYVVTAFAAVVLGASAVAELETARVVAQPVFVIAAGISAALTPQLLRAATRRGEAWFVWRRQVATLAVVATGVAGSLLLLSGPLGSVLGRPVDALLASSRAASFGFQAAASSASQVYVGAQLSGRLASVATASSLLGVATTVALMPALQEFSVPVGLALGALLRLAFLVRDIRSDRLYSPTI